MNIKKIYKFFKLLFNKQLLSGLSSGIAATTEHIPLLKSFKNLNTIIDIGANKGQFSLVARHLFHETKIIGFEPLLKPAEKYRNLFKNDKNVFFHQTAIGNQSGNTQMHISKREDSSSILPIGDNQSNIFPGTEESHILDINIGRLKEYVNINDLVSPVFVKIDVQGFELNVLKGCLDLIDNFDYIYVETSFVELYEKQPLAYEIISFLKEYSFDLKGIYNSIYDKEGLAVQADLLFNKT